MSNLNQSQGVSALQKKEYGIISIVCLIYCCVAAGAFGVEEIIGSCGPGMTMAVLIGMAVLYAYPVCLGTAEIASVMPGEGGYYYWTKHMLGEFWGYVNGTSLAVSFYTASSTYVVLSANYLASVVHMTNMEAILFKVAVTIVFTIINLLGLKEVSFVSTIFAVLIVLLFATISIVGFGNWNYNPVEPFLPQGTTVLQGIGSGIGLGIWMYCGWAAITPLAGEIANPQVMARGMKIAIPLVALTYIIPTIAGLASVGNWDMWTTDGGEGIGFNSVLQIAFGAGGVVIFAAIAIVSNLSQFNTNMAGGSRSFFVMADDKLFPGKFITKVSKNRGIPYFGVITMSIVTLIMMELSFEALVLIQVIPCMVNQFLMAPIIIKARKEIPLEKRENCYHVGWGRFGYLAVVIIPAAICIIAFYLNGLDYFLYGIIFMVILVICYFPIKIKLGGLAGKDPDRFPKNERTKLAFGDLFRIADLSIFIGALSFLGYWIFQFVEGSWGVEYYLETYGTGLLSSFNGMRMAILITGAVLIIAGIVLRIVGNKVDKKMPMPKYVKVAIGKLPEDE